MCQRLLYLNYCQHSSKKLLQNNDHILSFLMAHQFEILQGVIEQKRSSHGELLNEELQETDCNLHLLSRITNSMLLINLIRFPLGIGLDPKCCQRGAFVFFSLTTNPLSCSCQSTFLTYVVNEN